jgi:ribulose-phosphate 3-epimerase
VNPGWGGQKFIAHSIERISEARSLIDKSSHTIHLEVDGGINAQTAASAVGAGADTLVAGTYVFGSQDYAAAVSTLKSVNT